MRRRYRKKMKSLSREEKEMELTENAHRLYETLTPDEWRSLARYWYRTEGLVIFGAESEFCSNPQDNLSMASQMTVRIAPCEDVA